MEKDNAFFKRFKNYKEIQPLIALYKKAGSHKNKIAWIRNNPIFLSSLIKFRTELKRSMVKYALDEIISFLRCKHELDHHINDMKECSNIIVSEFLLNNRAKSDIKKTFERILSSEIKKFPFPKSLLLKDADDEKKHEFIAKRNFKSQFHGIYNILKEPDKTHYFIFRIMGIKCRNDFQFKYNKVTFYHPEHTQFSKMRQRSLDNDFFGDFFKPKTMLFGVVKVNYFSHDVAINDTINTIKTEIEYLNSVCDSNARLEKYAFLVTSDFDSFNCHRSGYEKGHEINPIFEETLSNNPYQSLKKANKVCKNQFLECESIFIKAISQNNMAYFWNYLEVLFAEKANVKNIIEDISSIMLLTTDESRKFWMRNWIESAVTSFNEKAEVIGLTKERKVEYYGMIFRQIEFDYDVLSKELTHPFILHQIKVYRKGYSKPIIKSIKSNFVALFSELKAQRNSIVHNGLGNERALIMLNTTLLPVVRRLRRLIMTEMLTNKKYKTIEDLVIDLKNRGNKLIE